MGTFVALSVESSSSPDLVFALVVLGFDGIVLVALVAAAAVILGRRVPGRPQRYVYGAALVGVAVGSLFLAYVNLAELWEEDAFGVRPLLGVVGAVCLAIASLWLVGSVALAADAEDDAPKERDGSGDDVAGTS